MGRNQFVKLAQRTGLSFSEACEYHINYQIDVGYAVHGEELERLHAEMREAREALDERIRNGLDTWPEVERINEAARRNHELVQQIYAPLLNGSR